MDRSKKKKAAPESRGPEFHITAGISPAGIVGSAEDYIRHDLRILKAALLYADRVTVCSAVGSLMGALASVPTMVPKQKLRLFGLLYPILLPEKAALDPAGTAAFQNMAAVIGARKSLTLRDINAIRAFNQELGPKLNEFYENFGEKANEFGFSEYQVAIDAGVAELVDLFAGKQDAVALVANCIAKGADPFGVQPGDNVELEYIEVLERTLQNEKTYPLFDNETGSLVRAGIREGAIKMPASGEAKSKNVQLAAELFERLPVLDQASVAEILDIRRDLDGPLIRFRGAMLEFSRDIKSAAWDKEFATDAELVFRQKVEPALLDIEEQVRSNRYISELAKRVLSSDQFFPAGGSVVGLAMSNYAGLPPVAGVLAGTVTGATIMASKAYQEWATQKAVIQGQKLYFYYRVGEAYTKSSESKK